MSVLPEVIALHRLVVGSETTVQQIGATDPAAMDDRAQERLSEYHANVLDRQELDGRAVRAWWDGQGAPTVLNRLLTCAVEDFGTQTGDAMQRLAQEAKGNAKSGLVVFTRLRDAGKASLSCFKLELEKLEEVQFHVGKPAKEALKAVDVGNLLPRAKQLQKAAIYPGIEPIEVWVVDDQLASPADYWMRFLGARAQPGEKQRLRQVIEATRRTLVDDLQVDDPERAIARAVALVRKRDEVVLPSDFVREAAKAANASAQAAVDRTAVRDPTVMDPQFSVTPLAARQTRTTYDLGGDVKVTGPRGIVEDRVTEVTENGRRYMKIVVDDGPHISYS
jgi:hypothetical protein